MKRALVHIAVAVLFTGLSATASTAQVDPRTALLSQEGWNALAEGRPSAAAAAFREALASDPRNPALHLGAGAAAYAERRDADARTELERAVTLAPRLVEARMLLGKVQYRTGDRLAAIATFEGIVSDAPSMTEARATLARWRRDADLHDRMQEVVGTSFTVSFEGPADEALAQRVMASLDRAYWRVCARLGVFPSQRLAVVVYAPKDFTEILQAPTWAVGAYDGTIRVSMRDALKDPAELDRVTAHEFTHALVGTLAPRGVPAWLDEGLATALEADDLGWAEECLRESQAETAPRTLAGAFSRLNASQARLAYATSGLAVRRLLEDAGGGAVVNLLRDLGEGISLDTASLHRLNRSLADLQASAFLF